MLPKKAVTGLLAGALLLTPADARRALSLCRETLAGFLAGKPAGQSAFLPEVFQQPRAVFVTLQKDGRARGCAGGFAATCPTLREELARFVVTAASQDMRYPPVTRSELEKIRIVVTFPGPLAPISSPDSYNPWSEGLLVRKDGREGIVLPREARTADYAFRRCLQLAGINNPGNVTLYKFDATRYAEETR